LEDRQNRNKQELTPKRKNRPFASQQLVVVAYYDDPAAQQAMRRVPSLPFIERWDLARPAADAKGKLLDQSKPGKGNSPQLLSSRKGLWSWTANNEIRDVFTGQFAVKLQFPENEELDVCRQERGLRLSHSEKEHRSRLTALDREGV
jgi:hypothetical protein